MTRKHYKIVAAAIKNSTRADGMIDKSLLVGELYREFYVDNNRFDSEKFKKACY